MIQLAVIITVILCLVLGLYGIVLLHSMRTRFKTVFLTSFFYYQILTFIFGVYGILGNLLIREILPKFDIGTNATELIAQFLPLIGLPFIIAAWYLQLKMTAELCRKKTPQAVAIVYFFITTVALLIYGLVIKNIPHADESSFSSIRQQVFLGYVSVELLIEGYIILQLLLNGIVQKTETQKKFLIRFALILLTITLFRGLSLYFSQIHIIIGLYFLLIYFAGGLPLILLTKVTLERDSHSPAITINIPENIFQQYAITTREKEIIIEICKGKSNQEIADTLFITLQTVKDHTHNIFQKTQVKNRVQLSTLFSEPKSST